MLDTTSNYGLRFKPPSYHEIKVKRLKEVVKGTIDSLEVYRTMWKKTICTKLTYGWTYKRGEGLF